MRRTAPPIYDEELPVYIGIGTAIIIIILLIILL